MGRNDVGRSVFFLFFFSFSENFFLTSAIKVGFPLHVTSRCWSHDRSFICTDRPRSISFLNMAPIRVGCSSRTERTIRRFSPDISFNPILLLGFCIEAFNAIIRYIFRLTAQTGRKPLARDKNLSYSSEVYDSEAWNSYLLSRSKSELKKNNPLIRMDDRQRTALESGSAKMNSLRLDHRDNSDKTSLHGIQNIVSQLANCGSKNLDIATAKTKENIGFLRGLGRFIQF